MSLLQMSPRVLPVSLLPQSEYGPRSPTPLRMHKSLWNQQCQKLCWGQGSLTHKWLALVVITSGTNRSGKRLGAHPPTTPRV